MKQRKKHLGYCLAMYLFCGISGIHMYYFYTRNIFQSSNDYAILEELIVIITSSILFTCIFGILFATYSLFPNSFEREIKEAEKIKLKIEWGKKEIKIILYYILVLFFYLLLHIRLEREIILMQYFDICFILVCAIFTVIAGWCYMVIIMDMYLSNKKVLHSILAYILTAIVIPLFICEIQDIFYHCKLSQYEDKEACVLIICISILIPVAILYNNNIEIREK